MKRHKYSGCLALLIIVVILAVDQTVKILVKTHMHLGESIGITRWFYITFIENNGMAYGMSFIYKPVLTLFRIVAVAAIGYYIYKVIRREHSIGYLICLAMIVAGAAGNIFDCFFYGQIFTASTPWFVSEFVPFGQGYAPVLQGRVVDMFYFPIINTTLPDWLPIWGGHNFIFFSPVFNFADACISVGVILVILFYRRQLETLSAVLFEGTRFERKAAENEEKGDEKH
ncbi:MAG: lipoprotein signal peptidase [Prevotella sp.]|nr:lipoprotein signal peptidase [Prevotella sp.]